MGKGRNTTIEVALPTSDKSTPRRKNLAATVLKYGEEISAKNREIAELETRLAECERKLGRQITGNSTGDDSELQEMLRSSALYV